MATARSGFSPTHTNSVEQDSYSVDAQLNLLFLILLYRFFHVLFYGNESVGSIRFDPAAVSS